MKLTLNEGDYFYNNERYINSNLSSIEVEKLFEEISNLDKNIQNKVSHVLYTVGVEKNRTEVIKLREERFNAVQKIIQVPLNGVNLQVSVRVHFVLSEEIARLKKRQAKSTGQKKERYQRLIETYLTADKKIIEAHSTQLSAFAQQGEFKIRKKDISVNQPYNNKDYSFVRNHRTVGDFSFTLKMGSNTYTVQGAGLDSNGCVKASGTFGRVFFGRDQNGRKIAIKVAAVPPSQSMKNLKKEGKFLAMMAGSQNVLGTSEVGYMEGSPPRMFVIMDHIEGSDLYDRMNGEEDELSIRESTEALVDIASGLGELHDKGIVHRDIKPKNILIEREAGKAFIVDLGTSASVEERVKDFSGSPLYMSPEAFKKEEQNTSSDLYGFGLMADELFSSEIPGWDKSKIRGFEGRMLGDITVNEDRYPLHMPLQAREKIADLVNSCLKLDPAQRITAKEARKQLSAVLRELDL
jgi:hypothetical protein